jgi:hypothetical protein
VFKKRSPKVVPLKLSHSDEGLCARREAHLLLIKMLQCRSKKGIAIPYFRAHSDFTAIKKTRYFLVSVLAQPKWHDF